MKKFIYQIGNALGLWKQGNEYWVNTNDIMIHDSLINKRFTQHPIQIKIPAKILNNNVFPTSFITNSFLYLIFFNKLLKCSLTSSLIR